VHTRVANQNEMATSFRFKDDVRRIFEQGKERAFVDQCGTEFVYGRRTGGEFYALFEYEFSSSEEEKRFSSAIEASGVGWKAANNASQEMAKFNMSAKIHVKVLRLGGSGPLPQISNLVDYGEKLPEIVASAGGAPVTLELITKDYSGVEPLDIKFNPELTARQFYVINAIAKNKDDAHEMLNTVRYVRKNSDLFILDSPEDIDRAELHLTEFINKQSDAAVSCFHDLWQGCRIPELAFPDVKIPKRRWEGSNQCNRSYTWSAEEKACCRVIKRMECVLVDANEQCLAHEIKKEKQCL
jgi:hypothetical protein